MRILPSSQNEKFGKVSDTFGSFRAQFGSLAAQFGSFPTQFGVRKNTPSKPLFQLTTPENRLLHFFLQHQDTNETNKMIMSREYIDNGSFTDQFDKNRDIIGIFIDGIDSIIYDNYCRGGV